MCGLGAGGDGNSKDQEVREVGRWQTLCGETAGNGGI